MKATALLEKQHRKVEAIFDSLEDGNDPSALVQELANELASHMAIEQNIFYPTIREIDPHLIETSFEEHAMAEVALKRLLKTSPSDGQFLARVSVLQELVHHHVEEEEEELFPKVEKALSSEQLEALGNKLEQAFLDAEREGFEALVTPSFAQTSADAALELIASEARDTAQSPDGGARAGR